jgi:hypothetical protein
MTDLKHAGTAALLVLWSALSIMLPGTPRLTAQSGAPVGAPADECSCAADYERLIELLEANYVALPIAYTGAQRIAYERTKAEVGRQAAAATGDECVHVLRRLTDFFADGHLFIGEYPRPDSATKARLVAASERTEWTEATLREHFDRRSGGLDPLEGFWYVDGYRVGIIRDTAAGREFAAVMLSGTEGWQAGHVRATFKRRADGGYDARFRAEDHTLRHYTARLQKDLLLHMPPVTWARELPAGDARRALLHPTTPRAPAFTALDPEHVVLSIPSHSPEHRAVLDSLLARHHADIVAARVLILDIRGNEGGSAGFTYPLRPYYWAEPLRAAPAAAMPVVLASQQNRRYFEGWGASAALQELLGRMDAAPGELVPFRTDTAQPATIRVAAHAGPAHVAVLMDRHVVSAGESFVQEARRSPRVTLFGENTGGVLDYANVSIVRLACASRGLALGYPLIAASAALPAGGINNIGIPPDVMIDADDVDPFRRIIEHYARH